uniref:Uncharacterized protein n=1 Tax=Kalanchoe fedtschenkoi TaxID=63787 RepID=A0A7N0UJA9_KALFE
MSFIYRTGQPFVMVARPLFSRSRGWAEVEMMYHPPFGDSVHFVAFLRALLSVPVRKVLSFTSRLCRQSSLDP